MNVNLRHLKAFVSIARLQSFTNTAKHLHLSQPALTVQIRQLEDALGVRLLDRNKRSVKLTQVGKELAPALERILNELDTVVFNTRELGANNVGVVDIAALPSVSATLLPGAIAKFREQYPGITVRLRDAVAQRILSMVKAEEVNFGIGSFARADAEVEIIPLLMDRVEAVLPPKHPLQRKKTINLKDLASEPLILMDPQSSVRSLVDKAFESIGHVPQPIFEITYMSTAIGLVKAGQGIALLPSSALEVESLAGLARRSIKHDGLARDIGVVQKTGRSLSPAAESFLRVMFQICRAKK